MEGANPYEEIAVKMKEQLMLSIRPSVLSPEYRTGTAYKYQVELFHNFLGPLFMSNGWLEFKKTFNTVHKQLNQTMENLDAPLDFIKDQEKNSLKIEIISGLLQQFNIWEKEVNNAV
jgi:hypothetical protein